MERPPGNRKLTVYELVEFAASALDGFGVELDEHGKLTPQSISNLCLNMSMEGARCAGNPELASIFDLSRQSDIWEARRICAECPVSRQCLLEGLKGEQLERGVVATLSAEELKDLREALELPATRNSLLGVVYAILRTEAQDRLAEPAYTA